MKLRKGFITITMLIIYILALLMFLFLFLGKNIIEKNNIKELLTNIDIVNYIIEKDEINNTLDNKRIPREIFNYIDQNSVNKLVDNTIDNLYNGNKKIIEENDIEKLFVSSIEIYERKYAADIYRYIRSDIVLLVEDIAKSINNEGFIESFNFINNILNSSYLLIGILVVILILITVFIIERKNAFLLFGVINTVIAILLFYFSKNLFSLLFNDVAIDLKEMFFKYFLDRIESICSVLFIIGIVLLLGYLVIYIKKLIVKSRINYYDKYYGR